MNDTMENALAYAEIQETKGMFAREQGYREDQPSSEPGFEEIIGQNTALRAVLHQIKMVAPTDPQF